MNISPELERNLWASDLNRYVSGTDEVERELWAQVGGKPRPSAQPTAQLQSEWAKLQASIARSEDLGDQLFREVASWHGRIPENCQPLRREG